MEGKIEMKELPWIAKYWREYRQRRRRGYTITEARKYAGAAASSWWKFVKNTVADNDPIYDEKTDSWH